MPSLIRQQRAISSVGLLIPVQFIHEKPETKTQERRETISGSQFGALMFQSEAKPVHPQPREERVSPPSNSRGPENDPLKPPTQIAALLGQLLPHHLV